MTSAEAAPILVVGGAGFIGSNLASSLLSDGHTVAIYDSLSRPGVERNLDWLRKAGGKRLRFIRGDVRDPEGLAVAVQTRALFTTLRRRRP